jgi:capsular exopolysaccharide synthesis family protein
MNIGDQLPAMTTSEIGGGSSQIAEIELRQIADVVRRRWWIVGICMAIGIACALVYVMRATPLFSSTATVLLDRNSDELSDQITKAGQTGSEFAETAAVETQIEVLNSIEFLKRVVVRNKLENDPELNPPVDAPPLTARLMGWIAGLFSSSQADDTADADANDPAVTAANSLQGMLTTARSGTAYVITVQVTASTPDKASQLANAISYGYSKERSEQRYERASRDADWLKGRLNELRSQLTASEDAVANFRNQNELTLSRDTQTVTDQQLADINSRLVAAQTDTAEKRVRLEQATQASSNLGNVEAVPEVMRSPVIQNLKQQDSELARKEADLAARYGPQHPQVMSVRAERGKLRAAMGAEVRRTLATIRSDYEISKAREDALTASLKNLTTQSGSNGVVGVQLNELERTAAANKAIYEDFLTRAMRSQEQAKLPVEDVRVITEAIPIGAPSWPRKKLTMALGAMLGLVVGVGISAALEFMASGFSTTKQVEDVTGFPVLATIMRQRATTAGEPVALRLIERPLSRYAESVRSIWAFMRTGGAEPGRQIYAVSSAFPQEGKSSVALALAIAAAENRSRVLLIDADLRRPSITGTLHLTGQAGLTDILMGRSPVGQAISSLQELSVDVLPAGTPVGNPSGLIASNMIRVLLEGLANRYDVVIVDTPPAGAVTDAIVLSQFFTRIIFVVKWQMTPREAVVQTLRKFPLRKIAGVVLNDVDPKWGHDKPYQYYGAPEFEKYFKDGD